MEDFFSYILSQRSAIHLILHIAVPLGVAKFSRNWKTVFIVMMATMLVDLDHLVANPIYDPNRCSIGFHPLHSYFIQPLYILLALIPKTRWIGIGLIIHMVLDGLDCFWMKSLMN